MNKRDVRNENKRVLYHHKKIVLKTYVAQNTVFSLVV